MQGIILAMMLLAPSLALAAEPTGREIIERMDRLLWGKTTVGLYEMTVTTPAWTRTLRMRAWESSREKTFIRILAPAKERGNATLRRGLEMWNYLENVERVVKIPPSMMLQSWMGSDFTNDDLVKESSIVNDYDHANLGGEEVQGMAAYKVEAVPKPEAPVVWGKILYWVRAKDFVPLREEFYGERGELIRVLEFSEIEDVGGRTIPTRWEMTPVRKEGRTTVLKILEMAFDTEIPEEVFTLRNMKRF
ncbi:MAG: outer membrane lipoprotein-sorting protein [Deltaproteobacteria bacterium]|nr:outer membrane lipoprotein-sorting protein [Deltaproteobacteria bacterium]